MMLMYQLLCTPYSTYLYQTIMIHRVSFYLLLHCSLCLENLLNLENIVTTAREKNICEIASYGITGSQGSTRCVCKTRCKVLGVLIKQTIYYVILRVTHQLLAIINNLIKYFNNL